MVYVEKKNNLVSIKMPIMCSLFLEFRYVNFGNGKKIVKF